MKQLVFVTRDLVFWHDKYCVKATMPKCLKPEYNNTTVIIDCSELKTEMPAHIHEKKLRYSQHRKAFTAKALVGITQVESKWRKKK